MKRMSPIQIRVIVNNHKAMAENAPPTEEMTRW